MIPSISGGSSAAGCNPISSNCVIWQGPDIPCINLCKGDSISQVLAHLAEIMCEVQAATCCDVSLLDPQCLDDYHKRTHGEYIPDGWVLQDYINLLIEYVCQLQLEGGGELPLLAFPECIRFDGISLNGTMLTQEQYDEGMPLVSTNTYVVQNDGSAEGELLGGQFNGWAEFVVNAICNLVACCGNRSSGNVSRPPGEDPLGDRDPDAPGFTPSKPAQNWIEKVVDNRFTKLSTNVKYIPPKVVPTGVTNKVGRPVAMEFMLTALEKEFVVLRKMTGTALNIRDSIRKQCINLANSQKLSGTGEIANINGWFRNPKNLAQSHSNQWALLCDITNAVRDIQKNHLGNTTCSDITYGAKLTLQGTRGSATGISVSFADCVVKAPFTDTDPKGAKIVVKDSSLNSLHYYVPVNQYQDSNRIFAINFNNTSIDVTSNYEVTIDYSFTDGTSVCAKTEVHTLENTATCPTVTFQNITGTSFKFKASGIDPTAGYEVAVICETLTGGEIGRVNYPSPSGIISGDFGGLMGGQSYNVYCRLKSKSGNLTYCDKNLVTTIIPACETKRMISSQFGTSISELSATGRVSLGCWNDGSQNWNTVLGFDINNGDLKIVKCDDWIIDTPLAGGSAVGCTAGESITTYGTFCFSNPSLPLVCGNNTYTTGFPQSQIGSGWQYVDAITGSQNTTYYIYALVNKANNSIDEVVACCDCKSIFLDPTNTMVYCKTDGSTDVKVNVAGFTGGKSPTYTITRPPTNGSVYHDATKDYDDVACFTYTNTSGVNKWTADSFGVKVSNTCGTSKEINVSINRAREIPKRDGDITIFVDTCTTTYSDAVLIKESFEAIKESAKIVCPNWTGTINYVPVDSKGNSADYINHAKAMIDMRAGATGSVTIATGNWAGWKSLPSHWDASFKGSVPTSAYIISFVNHVSGSCGHYGEDVLNVGFGAQPKVTYQQNYDELLDIVNGGITTTWGQSMNSSQPSWGYPIFGTPSDKTKYFAHALVPVIKDVGSTSAAAALQMASAILGEAVLTGEAQGLKVGNIAYPVNLRPYIDKTLTNTPIPYTNNVVTAAGNTMTGLKEYNYIPAFWLENGVDLSSKNLDLKTSFLSMLSLNENYAGLYCSGEGSKGNLMTDSGGRNTYGFGASCAAASTNARLNTNNKIIYNNTGTIFDTTVGNTYAFNSKQGCSEQHTKLGSTGYNDEIPDGWYAVENGAATYEVAQYTQGSGWTNHQCCDGIGGCTSC